MLDFIGLSAVFLISQSQTNEQRFLELKNQLEKVGFQVIISLPPQQGAYGLLQTSSKKIWINPVVFDLEIALPTIIHESVHAAQFCAGKGKMKALGLDFEPIAYARPFFTGYTDIQRHDLEREAYAVQTQSNSFELALSLLKKNCK